LLDETLYLGLGLYGPIVARVMLWNRYIATDLVSVEQCFTTY